MKLDLKTIPAKIAPFFQKLREYSSFMLIMLMLGIFSFIVLRIRTYATVQPSDAAASETLSKLKSPKLDLEAIEKIEKLESSNIDVKTLFDQARDNPFHD